MEIVPCEVGSVTFQKERRSNVSRSILKIRGKQPFKLNGVAFGDAGSYTGKKKRKKKKGKKTLRPVTRLAPTPPPANAYSVE
jgi:hypothetical protein